MTGSLPGFTTQIIIALLGLVVLVSGRRLFWLTVAIVGFVAGLALTLSFLEIRPIWLAWVMALLAGALGAALAIFLQKIAVNIAGFLMGGYVLVWLLQGFINLHRWEWLVYLIGGLVGLLLAVMLFELALIALTSLFGATLIVQVANFAPSLSSLLFVLLLIIGLVAQSGRFSRSTSAGNY